MTILKSILSFFSLKNWIASFKSGYLFFINIGLYLLLIVSFYSPLQAMEEEPYILSNCTTIATDDFSSGTNSGGSGWSNNWTFTNASIVSGELLMDGNASGIAKRTIDLSSYTSAVLNFRFKCSDDSDGFESSDFARVQISIDGGTTFSDYWYRDGDQICPNSNDNETYNELLIIPGGNATTVIRLESSTNSDSEDVYWDNIVITKPNPTAQIFAIQPSCNNNIPNSDGYLQISAISDGNRYHYSTGITFNDNSGANTYTNATDISSATFPLQIASNLANPSSSQDYTIRVYNGADDCYTDVMVTMNKQDCIVGCDCNEFIYLNETSNGGRVHKYKVTSSGGSLVPTEVGSPWLDNAALGETLTNPHGLASDLNGFIYIGETTTGDVRRITCDGDIIPALDFEIDIEEGYNYGSIGNTLYVNTAWYDGRQDGIYAFDLCTGDILGFYCLNGLDVNTNEEWDDWGMYVDKDKNKIYVTDAYHHNNANASNGVNDLWVIDVSSNILNPDKAANLVCVDPLISSGDGIINVGDKELPVVENSLWGVTTDGAGNIYIVESIATSKTSSTHDSRILKYAADGSFITASAWDTVEGSTYPGINPATGVAYTSNDRGYYKAIGIAYSSVSNQLYTSTFSPTDDCIALFDTDLNYLGAAVPYTNTTSVAKGIANSKECCPINNNITLDTTLCAASLNDVIFLQDLINCSGIVCEGLWQVGMSSGLSYNQCNNSIEVDALDACGSFTLESDGTGNNPQCGAFKITVNITVNTLDVTVSQTSCTDNGNGTFTTNYDAVINWNSKPCQAGEMINITHNGNTVGMIDPSTDSSPSTIPFTVSADGNGTNSIKAVFTIAGCSDSISFKTPLPCPNDVATCTSTAAGCLGGNAFEDYNCNGAEETNEPGVQGVQVAIYDCNNNPVDTVWTDSDGDWLLCGLTDGEAYRVEFILPESIACWASPTHSGSDNDTDVQFLTVPACTHFSLSSPADYCQENPLLVIPCYVNGDPTAGGTSTSADWMVFFRNDNSGEIGSSGYIAPEEKIEGDIIGTTWGTAYHRQSGFVLAGALMKRHSGFGEYGAGAIYKIDQAGTPTLFVDMNTYANVNTGLDTRGTTNNTLPASSTVASRDIDAFQAVGKVGFGDLDMSDDGQYLFAVNLNERTLIQMNVGSNLSVPATVNTYDIAGGIANLLSGTSIACGNISDYRPWALKYYRGLVYIGVVCSAETSQTASELHTYVLSFDPNNSGAGFSLVVDMAMDYGREAVFQSDIPSQTLDGTWLPWGLSFADAISTPWRGVALPSPILSDIEFDGSGAMILGIMDRFGMQSGYRQLSTDLSDSNADYQGMQAGDLIRFCNVAGVLTRENGTTCPFNTSPLWPNPPTDLVYEDEFYAEEELFTTATNPSHGHPETALGSLAFLPGSGEITAGVYDPFALRSGGVAWYSNTDGSTNKEYELYESLNQSSPDGTFGKAASLGDLEMMCDPAPLEIGNYVWCDSIENGIQDACELGIDNMLVQLYDEHGKLVGQDTTSDGNYYFNQYNVDTIGITVDGNGVASPSITGWTGMNYSTKYYIVFGGSQYSNATGEFTIGSDTYTGITTVDVNSNGNDNIDSDVDGSNLTTAIGSMPANLPTICMTTDAVGCGNHQYDMGILCTSCFTIDSLIADRVICSGDLVDTLALTTTLDNPDSIAFVYFTSKQTDSNVIYSNGTGIDTIQVASNTDTVRLFDISGFTNPGTTPDTFYVYGIAHPTPTETTCRPYEELLVIVQPDPTATVTDVLKCATNSETIEVSPSGGTAPYTYSWSGPFITNPGNVANFMATSSGTYMVTVTDAEGCTITASGEMTFQSKVCFPATFTIRRGERN